MTIDVRLYEESDRAGFAHVRSHTYRGGQPIAEDDRLLYDDCKGVVATIDGQIAAAATVLDMNTFARGHLIRTGGVAGVGVLPEFRSKGVGKALMRGLDEILVQLGYEMASLYPFHEKFYRTVGYGTCGSFLTIEQPSASLHKFRPEVEARSIPSSDWKKIVPCYESFAKRFNGMNIRNDMQWWRHLGGDTPFMIYVVGDPVECYALIRLEGDFWVPQNVRELAWTSRRGYESMMEFLRGLCVNKTSLVWNEPIDGPFMCRFADRDSKLQLKPMIMFKLLSKQLISEHGLQGVPPEVAPQLFMGDPSWNAHKREGSVKGENDALPPATVYCLDRY